MALKLPPQLAAQAGANFEASHQWGPTGWRPLQVPAPWQQIGVYGDARLNQYPARWEGAQLWNGVGSLSQYWEVRSASFVPYWQQTQQQAVVAGGQRFGGAPGTPAAAGPIASRQMRASVLNAQIAQSGLAAMSWADQLKVWSGHAGS